MTELEIDAVALDAAALKRLDDGTLFAAFASAAGVTEAKPLLTELIARKLIPKQADHPDFERGWEMLVQWGGDSTLAPEQRLLAVAELVRAAQAIRMLKQWQARLAAAVPIMLREPLPAMALLSDGDDRLNVARACSLADAEWVAGYVAQAVASEDKSKHTWQELVNALAARSESLAAMLQALAEAFATTLIETNEKADTLARRLAQAMMAFRAMLLESDLESGKAVGAALDAWLARPLKAGFPKTEKARLDYAREVLLTIHDLVRTRFSLATDAESYQVLQFVRRQLGKWPDELERELGLVLKDVSEALIVLGRQGVIEPQLLAVMQLLCNYPDRARFLAKRIAEKHTELQENVRDWLIEGRVRQRQSSEFAEEEVARRADAAIGMALIDARRTSASVAALKPPMLSTLELYEENLCAPAGDCFGHVEALVVQVDNLARQRGVGLYGSPGEVLEASPKFFDWVGQPGGKNGTVQRPAVIRLRSDGSVGDVIVKGLLGM